MLRKRLVLSAVTAACLFVTQSVRAHMVFVVPDAGNQSASVMLSESLKPADGVPVQMLNKTLRLTLQDSAGKETPLAMSNAGTNALRVQLGDSPRVIYGQVDLGVMQRGDAKPNWLRYYPKAIVGNAFDEKATLGGRAPVEIVPVGVPGVMRMKLLADGKPVAGGEVVCVDENGEEDKYATDADGLTPVIEQAGRLGFWARNVQPAKGELNGKAYEEIRRYATLVIGTPAKSAGAVATASPATMPATAPSVPLLKVEAFTPMPEPASSFGAVGVDGYLYVYGGHTADTHNYDTKSVSGQFHRLNLAEGRTWETLPAGPHLQGMNLAAYDGRVYRIGGMSPQNKEGDAEQIVSVNDVSLFDPATKAWSQLAALPEPRSSHDVVVIDGKLFVLGGWTLSGKSGDATWPEQMLSLDLNDKAATWQKLEQPFKRRALIAAAYNKKIYAIGGFDSDNKPSLEVNVFDTATGEWTTGPKLPSPNMNGFSPAACVNGDRLFVSVGDGSLLRLSDDASQWELIAKTTPRIVHRLVPDGDRVLVIGGAMRRKQVDLIEAVRVVTPNSVSAR
ncbi:MAG: hypothetical protein QM754_03730 [Tepidisphaeraceae bacterium]